MIYARAYGKVSRAPLEQQVRPGGVRVASIGLTVNVSGEFIEVNGVAVGGLAENLLALQMGDSVEVSGPIQVRTHVDEAGVAFASFDIKVREVSRPQANRGNQA
jgi:hypothetical protein